MAHGIESLFSSLPFSAPENVARAKLAGPLGGYRALTADDNDAVG